HLGLNKKLSELEADSVIVLEVRGPLEQVSNVLKTTDGVAKVRSQPLDGDLVSYEVRTRKDQDLREALSQRLMRNSWPIRRLDLRRRDLQDRWNEINNFEDAAPAPAPPLPPAPPTGATADGAPSSTQVTA